MRIEEFRIEPKVEIPQGPVFEPNIIGIPPSDIIGVEYPPLLAEMRRGRRFVAHTLNDAFNAGLIQFVNFGVYVEVPRERRDGAIVQQTFEIEQLTTTLSWTENDERRTPRGRIDLAKSLIENVINTHEVWLEQLLRGSERLLLSERFHYLLGPLVQPLHDAVRLRNIYTAYCKVTPYVET